MEESFLTRREHEEVMLRLDAENSRQNARIGELEEQQKQITSLTISVEKLAVNMESMLRELSAQGNRLKVLENRDGEMWRKVVGCVITTLAGAIIGFVIAQLGIGG